MFSASYQEILEIVRSEHEAKMEGLARYVLAMKTKDERRKWLLRFQEKHGEALTMELKVYITELHQRTTS